MSIGPAFRAAVRTLHARPAAVLPFYVAALAAPVAAQAVLIAGLVVAYLSVAGTGRFDALYALLEDAGPISIDDPDAVQRRGEAFSEALSSALADVVTPTVLAIGALTAVTAVVVAAVVNSLAAAGQLHAVYANVTGRSGPDAERGQFDTDAERDRSDTDAERSATRAGVDGAFRHWATFLALAILELVAFVAVVTVVAVAVGVAAAISPILAALVGLGLALPWIGASILFRLTFAFARPVAVVDDVGAIGALRSSFGYVTSRPLESFGYGILAVVGFATVAAVAGVFTFLGAPTVSSLLSGLALLPFLDVLKTVLYADEETTLELPSEPAASAARRLREALTGGLAALGGFVRGHPVSVLASVALFAGGIALGLRAGGQVDELFVASIEARLAQVNPVGSFFEYAANNWTVAAAGAFSGFAFGLPSATMLLFNGANVGLLYAIETDPLLLLAFVLPHGLVEIPALLFSGAFGLHLGAVALRYAGGSLDRARLAAEVDRAFRVAVGLAALLLVAALVEAVVSPYYWRILPI